MAQQRVLLIGIDPTLVTIRPDSGCSGEQITAAGSAANERLAELGYAAHTSLVDELMRRMLDKLRHLYMIDLMCDPEVQPFYARLGLQPSTGMVVRNFDRQQCDEINPA